MKTQTILLALLLGVPFFHMRAQTPPSDSQMAKTSTSPFGTLENALKMKPSGYRMESVSVSDFEAAELPKGVLCGIKFKSMAMSGGGKGDCTITGKLPQDFKMLGGWFYISPDTTIQRIGFQIQESGGEYFLMTFPADFTGWKWLEGTREDIVPMVPNEKSGFDGVLDQPATRVSIVWFAKDQSPSEVGVAGLTVAGE
ncbi:MAG: carbohydrate binding domain-containing protein [Verrucomicrobiota bacterium]